MNLTVPVAVYAVSMPRCATCTHWTDTEDDYGICAVLGAGWDDTSPPVYLTRAHTVFTRYDFGCTEHQPEETEEKQ